MPGINRIYLIRVHACTHGRVRSRARVSAWSSQCYGRTTTKKVLPAVDLCVAGGAGEARLILRFIARVYFPRLRPQACALRLDGPGERDA